MEGERSTRTPKIFRNFERPTKRCMYIIGGFVVLGLLLCILLIVQLGKTTGASCPASVHCDRQARLGPEFLKDERCDTLCITHQCVKSAEYTLNRMDTSKDPCHDFYEFSCGTFIKQTDVIPKTGMGISIYQDMEDNLLREIKEIIDSIPNATGLEGTALRFVKAFYDDCMSPLGTDKVFFNGLTDVFSGKEKLTLGSDDSMARDPSVLMSHLALTDDNPLFQVDIYRLENSRFGVQISEKDWSHLKNMYKDFPKSFETAPGPILLKYQNVMIEILKYLNVDREYAFNISQDVLNFEASIVKAVIDLTNARQKDKYRSHYPKEYFCKDLEHHIRQINWCSLLNKFLEEMEVPAKFRSNVKISVALDYFEAIDRVLGRYDEKIIIKYFVVKHILNSIQYLDETLRDIYYRNGDLFPRVNEFRVLDSRWKQCIDLTSKYLWSPLKTAYMKQKFTTDKQDQVDAIEREMRNALSSIMDNSTWLEKEFKADVMERIELMELTLGNSEFSFPSEEKLDKFYAKLTNEPHAFILDVHNIKKFNKRAEITPDMELHIIAETSPFTLLHDVRPGSFEYSYGIFSFPLFLQGRPKYIDYSTLGVILLHDMAFAVYREVTRNLEEYKRVKSGFSNVEKCLKDQFSKYKIDELDTMVNGHQTINGNFADSLALLGSLEAYRIFLKENGKEKGLPGLPFSNEQLFFISYAQTFCENPSKEGYKKYLKTNHSPAKYRVNGPLSNSDDFAEAFQCPPRTPMNPQKKCCLSGNNIFSSNKCM